MMECLFSLAWILCVLKVSELIVFWAVESKPNPFINDYIEARKLHGRWYLLVKSTGNRCFAHWHPIRRAYSWLNFGKECSQCGSRVPDGVRMIMNLQQGLKGIR